MNETKFFCLKELFGEGLKGCLIFVTIVFCELKIYVRFNWRVKYNCLSCRSMRFSECLSNAGEYVVRHFSSNSVLKTMTFWGCFFIFSLSFPF